MVLLFRDFGVLSGLLAVLVIVAVLVKVHLVGDDIYVGRGVITIVQGVNHCVKGSMSARYTIILGKLCGLVNYTIHFLYVVEMGLGSGV